MPPWRGLSLYKVSCNSTLLVLKRTSMNSDSALLVLNGTSLNSDSALLVLNGTSMNSDRALLVLNRTSLNSDSALLVLNRTSLNSDSALLALNWLFFIYSITLVRSSIQVQKPLQHSHKYNQKMHYNVLVCSMNFQLSWPMTIQDVPYVQFIISVICTCMQTY